MTLDDWMKIRAKWQEDLLAEAGYAGSLAREDAVLYGKGYLWIPPMGAPVHIPYNQVVEISPEKGVSLCTGRNPSDSEHGGRR